jgi:hypothetical protein
MKEYWSRVYNVNQKMPWAENDSGKDKKSMLGQNGLECPYHEVNKLCSYSVLPRCSILLNFSHEIPHNFWNVKFRYHVHKSRIISIQISCNNINLFLSYLQSDIFPLGMSTDILHKFLVTLCMSHILHWYFIEGTNDKVKVSLKKVKFSLYQALQACRVVRCWGSHIF